MKLGIVIALLLMCELLSAQEPKPRATLDLQDEIAGSLAISPDGKTLASVVSGDIVKLWDLATLKNTASFRPDPQEFCSCCSIAFSPDGRTLAEIGSSIKLWNVAAQKSTILLKNRGCPARTHYAIFSPDGKTVATSQGIGQAGFENQLWDVATGKSIAILEGSDCFGGIAYSTDGKTLLTVEGDGVVHWDAATGKETQILKAGERKRIEELIDKLGSTEVPELDKTVRELEAVGPFALGMLRQASKGTDETISSRAGLLVELLEPRGIVTPSLLSTAFSPDGKILATLYGVKDDEAVVKLWDVVRLKETAILKTRTKSLFTLAFNPDGKFLAAGSCTGEIELWEVKTRKELATLKGHEKRICSLAFSHDGKTLASGSEDKTIKLWDLARGK